MEILIERKNIPFLRNELYQRVEVIQHADELRIHLYSGEEEPLVFVMVEPAAVEVERWLARP